MKGRTLVLFAAVLSTSTVRCSDSSGESKQLVDDGVLCVLSGKLDEPVFGFSETPPQQLQADQPLAIKVSLPDCLSQSCDVDRKASCEARLEGTTIVVSSRLEWRSAGESVCTSDCGRLTASCRTAALPAGSYTVQFGDSPDRSITIPSTLTPACTGLER